MQRTNTHSHARRASFLLSSSTAFVTLSYAANRFLHKAITDFGVACVFFANTSAIRTASESVLYMIRQTTVSSTIRSSAQRFPIEGIGRDSGIDRVSPRCSRRKATPASILAAALNGGVLISPCRITSGLSLLVPLFSTPQIIPKLLYEGQRQLKLPQ